MSHIQRFGLATEETTATQQVSHTLSTANPAHGHKEVLKHKMGHIMMTTRYSDQQESKSRQNPCQVRNQPRTSETYRRQDDVFEYEQHFRI